MNHTIRVTVLCAVLLLQSGFTVAQENSSSFFDRSEDWLVNKNLEISYGVQWAHFIRNNFRLVQSEYDRDLFVERVRSEDSPRLEELLDGNIGTVQFRMRIGLTLSRNYSVDFTATHLTYQIRTDQTYYMHGRWNGEELNGRFRLDSFAEKLEHSNGLNTLFLGLHRRVFTKEFHSNYTVESKSGISLGPVVAATQSAIYSPNDELIYYDPLNSIAGFGVSFNAEIEFSVFKRFLFIGNWQYFHLDISRAKIWDDAYLKQRIRGNNWGLSVGYRIVD